MGKLKLKLPENLGDILTKDEMKKVVGGVGSYDDGSDKLDEWFGSGSSEKCICYFKTAGGAINAGQSNYSKNEQECREACRNACNAINLGTQNLGCVDVTIKYGGK